MYIQISRKNFKQDISEQKPQTEYIHRHFKCVAGCPAPISMLFYWDSQVFAFN